MKRGGEERERERKKNDSQFAHEPPPVWNNK
jgi:hypothetical protein